MKALTRLAVIALALVAVTPAAVRAQDDAFKDGVRARNDKKWAEVIRHMRVAIQADSTESRREVRTGFLRGSTPYLPHYFLGEAQFNSNNCVAAVEAWAISERQGVVKGQADLIAGIQRGYKECAAKGVLPPADFEPLNAAITQQYEDANTAWKRISDLSTGNAEAWNSRPDLREQLERARVDLTAAQQRIVAARKGRVAAEFAAAKDLNERAARILTTLDATFRATIDNIGSVQKLASLAEETIGKAQAADREIEANAGRLTPPLTATRREGLGTLAKARDRLDAGVRTQSRDAVNEAHRLATDAAGVLGSVQDQLRKLARSDYDQQYSAAVSAATQVFQFADSSLATFERLSTEQPSTVTPALADERRSLEQQLEDQRRRYDRARRSGELAGIRDAVRVADELRVRLDALINSFGPRSLRDRGVNAALEQGARLYLAGDYARAVAALDPIKETKVNLQPHVHLFRAAALHAMFVLSGEQDASLRAQAQAEVIQCRQLDQELRPDPRAFSPRFISFFQQVSPQATQAAQTSTPAARP